MRRRLEERAAAWRVEVECITSTETSILAFGRREGLPIALKVVESGGDEWAGGAVLDAFEGRGCARVLAFTGGATLLERLNPATTLASLVLDGEEERATEILGEVVATMNPRAPASTVPGIDERGGALGRYTSTGDRRVPAALVAHARDLHRELCSSQSGPRLLHGDLHHDNVLFDRERGWLAIDPKGVVGEAEYELGAALRNPYQRPESFLDPRVIEKRVRHFARRLRLDAERIFGWAFVQAVLSMVWAVEDGHPVGPDHPCIALAETIRSMSRYGDRRR